MTTQIEPKGGRVIAGKFRLEWPIGRGGMGTVWAAMHLQLDMPVAVKFMDPSAADADGRQRFEREAKAIAQLRSPHVVQVLDHGIDGGTPYIVMELLEGEDLEGRLKRVKKLPLPVATRIFTQSAKALRKAHDAGIVHRDLKPNNVFLARVDDEEIVKLLDFGVAKMTWTGALDPHNESTQQGLLLGSPCYMSPEQARGNKNVDHRSDLWALAVILFRSITGVRPFDAATVADLIIKICAEPAPIASQIAPDLPAGLDQFFVRAFSHDPDQRYQSAFEMASDFEAIVKNHASSTENQAGARIVGGSPMTRTNPGFNTQPSAASPNLPIAPPPGTPQRTMTNPAMRALSMSGQLVPADPSRRASMPSIPAFELPPTQPSAPDLFVPPPTPSQPYAAAGRLSYPGDPNVAAGFGSSAYPAASQEAAEPAADPYAQGYAPHAESAAAAPHDDPHGYAAGSAQPYGQPEAPGAAPAAGYAAPGHEQPYASQPPPAEGSGYSGAPEAGATLPTSTLAPDSASTLGSTSNTLRERSPSGRQLVVWTVVAGVLTAVLVVAIFIVARSRGLGDARATSARPNGSADVSLTPPASTSAQVSAPEQPHQAPPTIETTAPPPVDTEAPSSSAAPSSGPGVPAPSGFRGGPAGGSGDAAGASSVSPSGSAAASQAPKSGGAPQGKKTKPNFGY